MSERKIWTSEEDSMLLHLYQERKVQKWTEVARLMEEQFGVCHRNGKQCRQRYHNHLKRSIRKEKWTKEEQIKLIELHNSYGNKWAFIARAIPGRTDNCVKNQLYSLLRKGVRVINNYIKKHFRRFKQQKITFIYKLIEAAEENYKSQTSFSSQRAKSSLQIKKKIIQIAFGQQNSEYTDPISTSTDRLQEMRQLLQQISSFNKLPSRNSNKIGTIPEENSQSSELFVASKHKSNPNTDSRDLIMRNIIEDEFKSVKLEENPQLNLRKSTEFSKNVDLMKSGDIARDFYRSMQYSEPGFKSPTPKMFVESPYFDELKPSFSKWANYESFK